MQDWMNKYFLVVFPFFFFGIWLFSTYWVAVTSGWRLLAKRFRMQGDYSGQKWKMQSARMRWLTAVGVMPSSVAAREKLPSRTQAASTRRDSKGGSVLGMRHLKLSFK